MIIFWRGLGFLVPVIAALVFFIPMPLGLGGVLAGVTVWFLGRRLNGRPGSIMVDAETGQAVEIKSKHDLYFIPMEYWGAVLAVSGILLAL